MDPLTTASAFASIVGLLGVFRSERRAGEATTIDEYVDWLRRREHGQIADMIQSNSELSHGLQNLLSQNHEEVMAKLNDLNQVLADVATHVSGFEAIASAITDGSRLSEQAVSFLRQMNDAGASKFLELKLRSGTRLEFLDGQQGRLEITDSRFIEDDLLTLCDLGLLRFDYNSQDSRFFTITRSGADIGGYSDDGDS